MKVEIRDKERCTLPSRVGAGTELSMYIYVPSSLSLFLQEGVMSTREASLSFTLDMKHVHTPLRIVLNIRDLINLLL